MDLESAEEWIDYIRKKIDENQQRSFAIIGQTAELSAKFAALESAVRERMAELADEIEENAKLVELRSDTALAKLDRVDKKNEDRHTTVLAEIHAMNVALNVSLAQLQVKSGLWGFAAGIIPAVGVLLWWLLTGGGKKP